MKSESISIGDIKIPYGARDIVKPFIINRAESVIVRNDSAKVIMPGEYVEIYADELKSFDGEVAIESRTESPLSGQWPIPSITRVIQGSVRIPNLTNEPVSITKSQHLAQIHPRRDTTTITNCFDRNRLCNTCWAASKTSAYLDHTYNLFGVCYDRSGWSVDT